MVLGKKIETKDPRKEKRISLEDDENFIKKLDFDDVFDLDERYKNLDGYYQKRLFNPPWKF